MASPERRPHYSQTSKLRGLRRAALATVLAFVCSGCGGSVSRRGPSPAPDDGMEQCFGPPGPEGELRPADFGGTPDARRVGAFVRAGVLLEQSSGPVHAIEACKQIGVALGASEAELTSGADDSIEGARLVCERASARARGVIDRARATGGVTVHVGDSALHGSFASYSACLASCDASHRDVPGALTCDGTARGQCRDGACDGRCEVALSAPAPCDGECTGECSATCTSADPQDLSCGGRCNGQCTRACIVDVRAAPCAGQCTGTCSGQWIDATCGGALRPNASVSAACRASCDAIVALESQPLHSPDTVFRITDPSAGGRDAPATTSADPSVPLARLAEMRARLRRLVEATTRLLDTNTAPSSESVGELGLRCERRARALALESRTQRQELSAMVDGVLSALGANPPPGSAPWVAPTGFRARVAGAEIRCSIEPHGDRGVRQRCLRRAEGETEHRPVDGACRNLGDIDFAPDPGAEQLHLCALGDGTAAALVVRLSSRLAALVMGDACPRARVQPTDLVTDSAVELLVTCAATTHAFRWQNGAPASIFAGPAPIEHRYDSHAELFHRDGARSLTYRWAPGVPGFLPAPDGPPPENAEAPPRSLVSDESAGPAPAQGGRAEVTTSEGTCVIEASGAGVSARCSNQESADECSRVVIADIAPDPGAETIWDCGVAEIATIVAVRAADGRLLSATALGETLGAELAVRVVDVVPDALVELYVEAEGRNGGECDEGGDSMDYDRFVLKWRGDGLATVFHRREGSGCSAGRCSADVRLTAGSDAAETIRVVPDRGCGRARVHAWDEASFSFRARR